MYSLTKNSKTIASSGQLTQTSDTMRQLKNEPAMFMVIIPTVPIIVDTANKVPRIDWWLFCVLCLKINSMNLPYSLLRNLADVRHNGGLH